MEPFEIVPQIFFFKENPQDPLPNNSVFTANLDNNMLIHEDNKKNKCSYELSVRLVFISNATSFASCM